MEVVRKLIRSIPLLLAFGCRHGLPGAIEKRLASLPFIPTARHFQLCPVSSITVSCTTVFLDLYLCSRGRPRPVYHLARERYRYYDLGPTFLGIRSVERDHAYYQHHEHEHEHEHDPLVHLDPPVADGIRVGKDLGKYEYGELCARLWGNEWRARQR